MILTIIRIYTVRCKIYLLEYCDYNVCVAYGEYWLTAEGWRI